MSATCVRRLLIIGPCLTCLWLAASPPIVAREPKPQAKTHDIQGTWNLVSWEKNGKAQKPQKVRIFITDSWIYSEGLSLPDDKDGNFSSWIYELGPGDKPNAAILNLSGLQGRVMVPGLCALDGATLRIVLGRVTYTRALPLKDVPVDRPKEFDTKPGRNQLLLVLKRPPAADDPLLLLRKLGAAPRTSPGDIYLGLKEAKQATNEDLAIIKKYPLIWALSLRGCRITD